MVEAGKGEEILFRDYEGGNGAPVCARRFLSLADRGGDDDMFSSDYSDEELKVNLAREEEHASTVHFDISHCMGFAGHVHVHNLDKVLCDIEKLLSCHLTHAGLQERLGHCHFLASLVLVSGADEYMPMHVEHHSLATRLSRALGPKSVPVVIENGVHDLAGSEDALLQHVLCFLQCTT